MFNSAKSKALNVRLEFISDTKGIYANNNPFPYKLLNPQDSTEIIFHLTVGHPETIEIKFIWDDDFQKDNEFTQVLTL